MTSMEKYFFKLFFVSEVVLCVSSSDVFQSRFFESLVVSNKNKTSQSCSDALDLYFENLNNTDIADQWALESNFFILYIHYN